MPKSQKKTNLEKFFPKREKREKPLYTMVRFGKRKDLLLLAHERVKQVNAPSMNAYILALIEQDVEESK